MDKKDILKDRVDVKVQLATLEDASGIHYALRQNLIEVRDVGELTEEQKTDLEKRGFLRKEIPKEYYEKLIEDPNCDIYVAKNNDGKIIAFASIHKNKYNVWNFRSTLKNLYVDDEKIKDLLTNRNKKFAYLDQVSVIPEYQDRGVGRALLNKAFAELDVPVVSFIVELPLANIASARWHEKIGFDMAATCDGEYKGKKFKWWIYIFWNN